ncbi:hypothetical protein HPB48_015948 [Haemaphysalis longicornis]|uniref:Uncharacterized protein n=1 Tax=Haemaphysalis longicornis TaxID=44386 RepID=A0A9J6FPT0_HAELO|nr:hypothetical protein HPB48_015948 [Haemaphysalis longicornis]
MLSSRPQQVKRSDIRKGMVLVSAKLEPKSCWEFEGEILVLHHPTTISPRYQAMGRCGGEMRDIREDVLLFLFPRSALGWCGGKTRDIREDVVPLLLFPSALWQHRQTASILSMSTDCLRTGDKALVRFRFIKNPEYLRPGMRLVFREGRTKAVGNVLRLYPPVPGIGGHYHGAAKAQASKPQQQQQQGRNNGTTTAAAVPASENNGDAPLAEQISDAISVGGLSSLPPRAENEPQKASKRNRGRFRGPRMAPVI